MLLLKLLDFRPCSALAIGAATALALMSCGDDSKKSTPPDGGVGAAVSDQTMGDVPDRPRPVPPTTNPPVPNLPPAVPVEGPQTELCGSTSCRDRLIGDIVVEPCCVNGDRCGLGLSAVSGFLPVNGECVALEQPGSPDAACPSVYFDEVANPRELVGCCRPDGVCGVVADLSDTLANFGCVDPNQFLSGRGEQSPPAGGGDEEPGMHLTDGGGFYVTDAGPSLRDASAGQCVPKLPEPDAMDAAVADAALPNDAESTQTNDEPADAAPKDAEASDVGITTPTDPTSTSTPDAATTDAG